MSNEQRPPLEAEDGGAQDAPVNDDTISVHLDLNKTSGNLALASPKNPYLVLSIMARGQALLYEDLAKEWEAERAMAEAVRHAHDPDRIRVVADMPRAPRSP